MKFKFVFNLNTIIFTFFTLLNIKCISSLPYKIINLISILEYAQNDTHIFIHILNKKLLPIENLTVSLLPTSMQIKYELNDNQNGIKYIYDRYLILFSLSKNNTLFIKRENELNYIIFFEKVIPTFYWNFLDQETDDHKNIYIWFDLYEKYEEKTKINKYRDFVESNQIIRAYNNDIKENDAKKIDEKNNIFYSSNNRNKKIKIIKEEYENNKRNKAKYNKYKNKNNAFPSIKKCYSRNIDDILDLNFWIY